MPASKRKTSRFSFPSGYEIDFGIIYPWLLSQKAVNSCLACRTKHPERIRPADWEKGKECESRVGMSSGSQESCSPARGLGVGWRARCHSGGGRGVGDRWGVDCVCVCVCVCDWSAVAGDLLWRGGMREGLTRFGCPWSTHTHIHTHPLTPTLTGIRDTPDRDVTSLPSSLLFGLDRFLELNELLPGWGAEHIFFRRLRLFFFLKNTSWLIWIWF